MFEVKYY